MAVLDENGDAILERRFKPYGGLLSGTNAPWGFGWTGNTGSRKNPLLRAEQYNRARRYSTTTKQWTIVDPLWPSPKRFAYSSPLTLIDPSGRASELVFCPVPTLIISTRPKFLTDSPEDIGIGVIEAHNIINRFLRTPANISELQCCMSQTPACKGQIADLTSKKTLRNACADGTGCRGHHCQQGLPPLVLPPPFARVAGAEQELPVELSPHPVVVLCTNVGSVFPYWGQFGLGSWANTVLHEFCHACGIKLSCNEFIKNHTPGVP